MRKSNNFEENYLSIKVEKLFPGFLRIQNINFDLVASTPLLIMLLTKCRFLSTLGKVPKRMLLAPSLKMLFQLRYIIFSVFSYFKVSQRKSKANSTCWLSSAEKGSMVETWNMISCSSCLVYVFMFP